MCCIKEKHEVHKTMWNSIMLSIFLRSPCCPGNGNVLIHWTTEAELCSHL